MYSPEPKASAAHQHAAMTEPRRCRVVPTQPDAPMLEASYAPMPTWRAGRVPPGPTRTASAMFVAPTGSSTSLHLAETRWAEARTHSPAATPAGLAVWACPEQWVAGRYSPGCPSPPPSRSRSASKIQSAAYVTGPDPTVSTTSPG